MAPVVCAVLGLAAFAVVQVTVLNRIVLIGLTAGGDWPVHASIAALVLGLLAWHLSPRWAWPVLVALGALCATPTQFLLLSPGALASWMVTPYLVIDAAARPLLLVGLVGAAAAVWRAGRRGAGAALLGAPFVVPVLTSFVVSTFTFGYERTWPVPVTGLVLVAATVVAAIVAAVTGTAPVARPGWRVTVGGVVAGTASVVYQLWPATEQPDAFDGNYTEIGQHLTTVGLLVMGVALLAGLLAGPRVLVTGAAAGLLMSTPATLVGPLALNIQRLSTGTAWVLALAALAVGVAVALSRVRTVVGVAGLGVVIGWLLVLWLVVRPAEFDADNLGLVLVVLVVAAVPVLAALGTLLTPADLPAAFAGVAAGVAGGLAGISNYITLFTVEDESHLDTYLLVVVPLVVAAGLTVLAHRLWGRTDIEPVLGDS